MYLSDKKEIISSGAIKIFENSYKKLLYNYTKLSKGILKKSVTITILLFFFLCNVGSAFSVNSVNNQGVRLKESRSSIIVPTVTISEVSFSNIMGVIPSGMSSGIISGIMGSHHSRVSISLKYWMG